MSSRGEGRSLPFRTCDVFTTRSLSGNQLAVFEDAGALTDGEMQALAREMNLSETTFIVRRDLAVERAEGVRVRIFTIEEELPFAGHPTLGTAATIRRYFPEHSDSRAITLDLNVGNVTVQFGDVDPSKLAVYGEMTQPDPKFGALHERDAVAQALSLQPSDLDARLPIQTVSTGLAFCIVPLESLAALERLRSSPNISAAYLRDTDAKLFYCIAAEDAEGLRWRARMQFYNGEDPATGSAAGCAISYLVRNHLVPSDARVHLRQGVEIGRESDLYLSARRSEEKVSEVRVGGSTVPVAKGLVFLE